MTKPPANQTPDGQRVLDVIASGRVSVAFQPIVDLNDGMIVAYEALTRLEPDSGFSNPGELFQAAAANGLLWELESLTRSAAIETAAGWPADIRLFLNTTPAVFADARFFDALRGAISRSQGLSAERIVLEITELSDEQDFPGLAEQVIRLKDAGFEVAIDDAGAGTSGLNRMMVLRPKWIKLDRTFVHGVDSDPYRQNLVRFFVHFARLSGVSVIAEGIESKVELSTVIGLGARYAQGYYLGRPGERSQTFDPRFVSEVRGRWADVDAVVASNPSSASLVKVCHPVLTVDSTILIGDAASLLDADASMVGVVARDGRRVLGWASRQQVLDESATPRVSRPVSEILRKGTYQLPPTATIEEALELACLLEEETIADPLVITSGASVVGIVRVRDLLKAAAHEGRLGQSWRAPVTGLPARIRADQHLTELIRRAGDASARESAGYHTDAAFVDIRSFADYNSAFGYELGDRLIRSLSDLITATVVSPGGEVFLAHLGDDRFLLTGPDGTLEPRLRMLIQSFDRQSSQLPARGLVGTPTGFAPGLPCPRMTLRVLFLPDVFGRVDHPRDVYRLEQQLRGVSASRSGNGAGSSWIVRDWRRDPMARRLSA